MADTFKITVGASDPGDKLKPTWPSDEPSFALQRILTFVWKFGFLCICIDNNVSIIEHAIIFDESKAVRH